MNSCNDSLPCSESDQQKCAFAVVLIGFVSMLIGFVVGFLTGRL